MTTPAHEMDTAGVRSRVLPALASITTDWPAILAAVGEGHPHAAVILGIARPAPVVLDAAGILTVSTERADDALALVDGDVDIALSRELTRRYATALFVRVAVNHRHARIPTAPRRG